MDTNELLDAPSLDGQFPITFRNGFHVSTLGFWCPACQKTAPLVSVKGYVSRVIENVADVTAAMRCPCGEVTRYQIRLRDDKTYSYLRGGLWEHDTIVSSLKNRIRSRMLSMFHVCLLKWKCFRLVRNLKKLHAEMK